MRAIESSQSIKVPEGVDFSVLGRSVEVKGKRGMLKRSFNRNNVQIEHNKKSGKITVRKWFGSRKELAGLRTVCSHIENLFKGVTYGYRYKMKAVYAHFPINLNIVDGGKTVEIRNFLGEKRVRVVKMVEGVTCEQPKGVKDEYWFSGNDLEAVSRSSALVKQSVLVKKKDIRKFLDGIYVSEKTTVEEVA
ncbi:large ribosomal subunit protein uL6-like [Symsagittifera roscoffensis]|uniref:large ribosomal subunit protein uL6-like n=1 Tax=Symsagittifera roscoffensis TaxID=84072 RepID=UPI00307C195D